MNRSVHGRAPTLSIFPTPSVRCIVGALERLQLLNEAVWRDPYIGEVSERLAREIHKGIVKHGIVEVEVCAWRDRVNSSWSRSDGLGWAGIGWDGMERVEARDPRGVRHQEGLGRRGREGREAQEGIITADAVFDYSLIASSLSTLPYHNPCPYSMYSLALGCMPMRSTAWATSSLISTIPTCPRCWPYLCSITTSMTARYMCVFISIQLYKCSGVND